MGQYTVYCNGSQNLKNLSGGVGELRIDNLGADKADWGWLFLISLRCLPARSLIPHPYLRCIAMRRTPSA